MVRVPQGARLSVSHPAVPPSPPLQPAVTRFATELDRLVQQLWTWSPSRMASAGCAQTLVALAAAWVTASQEAAGAAPPRARLPDLEPHGLPDLLAVLGREVLRSPDAERAATQALEHLVAARAALL